MIPPLSPAHQLVQRMISEVKIDRALGVVNILSPSTLNLYPGIVDVKVTLTTLRSLDVDQVNPSLRQTRPNVVGKSAKVKPIPPGKYSSESANQSLLNVPRDEVSV